MGALLGLILHSSRQQVQHGITVVAAGTLAGNDTITASMQIDASRNQGVRIKQLKAAFQYNGKTDDEGPIMYGLSLDLSAAEVEEALEADPQGTGDTPAIEQANRKVFPIGVFDQKNLVRSGPIMLEEVHLPWKEIEEGTGIQLWIHNYDASALTTGGGLTMMWTAVQEWLRD